MLGKTRSGQNDKERSPLVVGRRRAKLVVLSPIIVDLLLSILLRLLRLVPLLMLLLRLLLWVRFSQSTSLSCPFGMTSRFSGPLDVHSLTALNQLGFRSLFVSLFSLRSRLQLETVMDKESQEQGKQKKG